MSLNNLYSGTGSSGGGSADLDAPVAHTAGTAHELPDAYIAPPPPLPAADVEGSDASRNLVDSYVRDVAPQLDPREPHRQTLWNRGDLNPRGNQGARQPRAACRLLLILDDLSRLKQ